MIKLFHLPLKFTLITVLFNLDITNKKGVTLLTAAKSTCRAN